MIPDLKIRPFFIEFLTVADDDSHNHGILRFHFQSELVGPMTVSVMICENDVEGTRNVLTDMLNHWIAERN